MIFASLYCDSLMVITGKIYNKQESLTRYIYVTESLIRTMKIFKFVVRAFSVTYDLKSELTQSLLSHSFGERTTIRFTVQLPSTGLRQRFMKTVYKTKQYKTVPTKPSLRLATVCRSYHLSALLKRYLSRARHLFSVRFQSVNQFDSNAYTNKQIAHSLHSSKNSQRNYQQNLLFIWLKRRNIYP